MSNIRGKGIQASFFDLRFGSLRNSTRALFPVPQTPPLPDNFLPWPTWEPLRCSAASWRPRAAAPLFSNGSFWDNNSPPRAELPKVRQGSGDRCPAPHRSFSATASFLLLRLLNDHKRPSRVLLPAALCPSSKKKKNRWKKIGGSASHRASQL